MHEPSPDMLTNLKQRYGEPQRHYHTWAHIQALLGHFEQIRVRLKDEMAVLWALYWHDAIYDPQAADNEDKSADLLIEMASNILPAETLQRADAIIRATKHHKVPEGLSAQDQSDMELFLDIDLSVLGAREDVFDVYEKNIRKEYAFVPELLYRRARGGILQGFLARERLYFSDLFQARWETPARANLKRSIDKLMTEDSAHV